MAQGTPISQGDIRRLRIFVSSPDQIKSLRENVGLEAKKLNDILKNFGVELDVITSDVVRSGGGKDGQDFLNRKLTGNYDIYIGLMWTRFGSPTPRAESGTQEEFQRAIKAWRSRTKENRILDVMFYFLDKPIKPSSIEADQIAKVLAFKREVAKQGVFHKTPPTEKSMLSEIRNALAGLAAELPRKRTAKTRRAKKPLSKGTPYSTRTSALSKSQIVKTLKRLNSH